MTGQERDYEAVLSHVLHTTADQFEPVGDGLTKIRERLSEPWLQRQWWLLRSELTVLRWFVVVRCQSLFSTLQSLFSTLRSRFGATDPAPGAAAAPETDDSPLRSLLSISTVVPGSRQQRPTGRAMAWLRPALAVAGAVVLVVAGVFALGSIRTAVGLDSGTGTTTTNSGPGTGNGNPNGAGSQLPASGTASQASSGAPSPSASAGGPSKAVLPVRTSASPSPSPTSASPSPSQTSPSPSQSPSPSPSQTSPSPSPSSSTSQAPLTGP